MNIRKTKRYIAAIAAIPILLFHLWIPVFSYGSTAGNIERFLIATGYIGVDIFFFISAYTMAIRPVEDYCSFLINRLVKLLPLFIVAWLLGELLWFIPSLMAVYVLFPPIYRIGLKKPVMTGILAMAVWAVLTVLLLGVLGLPQGMGNFLFRIPIIAAGAYMAAIEGRIPARVRLILSIFLVASGFFILYRFGYMNRISKPFDDIFYLTGIPATIGIIMLTDLIFGKVRAGIIERFGKITLEIYFFQMVAGKFLITKLFGITKNRLITNLFVLAITVAASVVINRLMSALENRFKPEPRLKNLQKVDNRG